MKRSKLAWIAGFAVSALVAVTFVSCGKEEKEAPVTGAGGAASAPATVFEITTSHLEKNGIAYSFTDGAAAYQMVDKMFDSFDGLVPDIPEVKNIFESIRGLADEFGLKTFLGSGTSVKKHGDYYRCIDFEYAPERKGLFWDLIGADVTKGPAPELKLTSPKSAVAFSSKMEPGALYAFIDKKLRATLDEDTMAGIDQQISGLASAGIQPDKLLECISGLSFYVEGREFKEEEIQEALANEDPASSTVALIPKFAFILTTKSDLCWKALENFISQSSPDIVKDGKIVPAEGIAIFQAGNYLIATNDEAAIRDRIAGKGTDLTANTEFAEMAAVAGNDFSCFSFVSDEYLKTISSLTGAFGSVAESMTGGAVPMTDPTLLLGNESFRGLATAQINSDGLTFTTVTPNLQVALVNSGTVAGVITGILPYIGPIAKSIMTTMDNMGIGNGNSADNLERQVKTNVAFAMLKEAEVPANSVFFALGKEGELVFAQWNEAEKDFEVDFEAVDDGVFPFVFLSTPDAAAKADKPEETVVFYEDPTEFTDGIFVVFGDGSVKFLDGDFDDNAEALEAVANTFDLSEQIAAELIKKGAELDARLDDSEE